MLSGIRFRLVVLIIQSADLISAQARLKYPRYWIDTSITLKWRFLTNTDSRIDSLLILNT